MKTIRLTIISSVIALFLSTPAGLAQNQGIVSLSSVCIRAAADYESPLETQELMGAIVDISDSSGNWLKIRCRQPYEGWVAKGGIIRTDKEETGRYIRSEKYIVTALYSFVLSNPEADSQTLCNIVCGDILRICHKSSKPEKHHSYLAVLLPDGRKGWVNGDDVCDYGKWKVDNQRKSPEQIIDSATGWAMANLGVPYLWGGMTPCGLDCSGLVRMSYLMTGIYLPRNASQILACGTPVHIGGDAVSGWDLSELRRGDLVFFGRMPAATGKKGLHRMRGRVNESPIVTHIGIYLGDGLFIHCSYCVRINSLTPSGTGNEKIVPVYENYSKLLFARRLVGGK